MKTIYLAGAINGCTDEEAWGWRVSAKRLLSGFRILDPMSRDYRGREAENVEQIVQGDMTDISRADIVLVNAKKPSWGTAMELVYAHMWGKLIVAVHPTDSPSPWLVKHSDKMFKTIPEACSWLSSRFQLLPKKSPSIEGEAA